MSYQQDLIKAHRERRARIWPVSKPGVSMADLRFWTSEVARLKAQAEALREELGELATAKIEISVNNELAELRDEVCDRLRVSLAQFVSRNRGHRVVKARVEFAVAARKRGASLLTIAYHIGGRNHTSVLYYLKKGGMYGADAEPMVG